MQDLLKKAWFLFLANSERTYNAFIFKIVFAPRHLFCFAFILQSKAKYYQYLWNNGKMRRSDLTCTIHRWILPIQERKKGKEIKIKTVFIYLPGSTARFWAKILLVQLMPWNTTTQKIPRHCLSEQTLCTFKIASSTEICNLCSQGCLS